MSKLMLGKKITNAVHEKGGIIFLQLWHVGRASHSSLLPNNVLPVAPSAIPITGLKTLNNRWEQVDYETPKVLTADEIQHIIQAYKQGAINAVKAGFDGVEIHAANGYLIEQFLHDKSNKRIDEYGGSIENRSRLLLEITKNLTEVLGSQKIGVRISPFGTYNDVGDSDPLSLYSYIISELNQFNLAYLSMIEARTTDSMHIDSPRFIEKFRSLWSSSLIFAGGFNKETAEQAIQSNHADAIAFGRQFIANPNLPLRFQQNAPLNSYDRSTFYGGGEHGYTDYSTLTNSIST